MICPGDVTRSDDVTKMIETTMAFGGKLDVLVNNAAMDSMGNILETSLDEWRDVLEVNLTGPFATMKAVIPHMLDNGGGSIINIASLAGLRCMPQSVGYCSSKAGLIMLTQQVALEEKIPVQKGVYAALTGPNLETAAEYRFLRIIGADVVGMSTVPEDIVAVHSGMKVLGLAVVTDICFPDTLQRADIEGIIRTAEETEPDLTRLIGQVVRRI